VWSSKEHQSSSILSDRSRGHSAGSVYRVPFPVEGEDATWLPADAAVLRALVERVLGPVLAHERARRSDLIRSLRIWLAQDRRTERAARLLSIHKHTLQYRLRRVEQLTGRDLTRVQDTVDMWLALRALEMVGGELKEETQ
jgi:DNA-binding PucR family transcriptional regulator